MDKAKGKIKEATGAMTDDEDKRAEGKAQQRKSAAEQELTKKEKVRREEDEARQKERELDRERGKDKGLLGNITDHLTGR